MLVMMFALKELTKIVLIMSAMIVIKLVLLVTLLDQTVVHNATLLLIFKMVNVFLCVQAGTTHKQVIQK